ncbi:hypothetical protein GF351_00625, partial [Candidatus Woesearchaeota archaeon]|nr:hypothetical protein [Candidatus Woesearchaeota archaeon]
MAEISDSDMKEIENEIRDLINWVKVFETEYDLPAEVVQKLTSRLSGLATKLG